MHLLAGNRYITLKWVKLKYIIIIYLQKNFIISLKALKQRKIKNKGKKNEMEE